MTIGAEPVLDRPERDPRLSFSDAVQGVRPIYQGSFNDLSPYSAPPVGGLEQAIPLPDGSGEIVLRDPNQNIYDLEYHRTDPESGVRVGVYFSANIRSGVPNTMLQDGSTSTDKKALRQVTLDLSNLTRPRSD